MGTGKAVWLLCLLSAPQRKATRHSLGCLVETEDEVLGVAFSSTIATLLQTLEPRHLVFTQQCIDSLIHSLAQWTKQGPVYARHWARCGIQEGTGPQSLSSGCSPSGGRVRPEEQPLIRIQGTDCFGWVLLGGPQSFSGMLRIYDFLPLLSSGVAFVPAF